MFLHKTNFLLKSLFPKDAVWRIPKVEKTIYLTFDDGPIPDVTNWVLEIIGKNNIKATFFCVGNNILKNPDVFQNVKDNGHIIANHTFHHVNGWKTNPSQYVENAQLCQDQILEKPRLFRPPYGRITKKQAQLLQNAGYQIIMWDVLSGDFERSISPETCLRKAIQYTENGSIVLFHDSVKAEKNMKYALPRYIDFCLENGYHFGTI